jgi:hypothetical protein
MQCPLVLLAKVRLREGEALGRAQTNVTKPRLAKELLLQRASVCASPIINNTKACFSTLQQKRFGQTQLCYIGLRPALGNEKI